MKKVFLLLLLFIVVGTNGVLASDSYESITINNKNMRIYKKGENDKTIVLLSSWGTENPIDDFKPLIDTLSSDYKVVAIEYFGYGESAITEDARSNKVIVEEIRAALKAVHVNPPYILMPHSMSGLYSLSYANSYAEEVSAIIGIDASLPEKQLERWTQESFETAKLDETSTTLNISIVNQWNKFFDNSMELKDIKYPINLPVLSFLASEQIKSIDEMIKSRQMKTTWIQINKNMITNPNIQVIKVLDGKHYLHHSQTEIISKYSKKFLSNIVKTQKINLVSQRDVQL